MPGMFGAEDLLDLSQCRFPELFAETKYVWEALSRLPEFVEKRVKPVQRGNLLGQPYIAKDVEIGEGTVIEHGAVIQGPTIIGSHCQVRCGAYIRGNVIVGSHCVLGNACEFKNAVLFNETTVPHFSYVGDSILGHKTHLGAGVILSNVKSIKGNVTLTFNGNKMDTGLRKFGAIIGDGADIGCNCVLNPGSIIGRGSILYPNVLWRGICPSKRIVKLRQQHEIIVQQERI